MGDAQQLVERCRMALCEAGRPDLAERLIPVSSSTCGTTGFWREDDLRIVVHAHNLARTALGIETPHDVDDVVARWRGNGWLL